MSDITWTPDVARLDSLDLWQHNPKQISRRRADRLLTGWQELGQFQTLAVGPDGECYDGHQRVKMLSQAGFPGSTEIAVLRASRPLTDAERRGVIMHSTLDTGQFDWEALAGWESAGWLDGYGFDADLLADWNTDAHNLSLMLEAQAAEIAPPEDAGPQVDRAGELQEQWQVAAGDIWQAGEHYVICGDCREPETWARLLAAAGVEKATLLLADPPYGVDRDEGFEGFEGFGGFGTPIARRQYGDDWDSERPDAATFDLALSMAKNAIIFGGNFFADILPKSTHWLVWDKMQTMPTFGDCELAWTNYARKSVKKYAIQYNGLLGKEAERFHPTQKPVKLFSEIIENYTDAGDVVLDPFLGSGTTIVAAHQNSRRGLGIERLEKYVAVILERLRDLGLEPQRVTP